MTLTAAFIFNLVQDVNILRPLAVIAQRDFGFRPLFLISSKMAARDPSGIWEDELEELALSVGAEICNFRTELEALEALVGQGILFAASETHLPNHADAHNIFRVCPPSYLRVTIQHGFECPGYLHGIEHIQLHGETASFGADIICSWSEASLQSMSPSQRSKLLVTGPTAVLQMPAGDRRPSAGGIGLVCENLHSVRFRGGGDRVREFVRTFAQFCERMGKSRVALRPHPGGQYALKNKVPLPANAYVENLPLYRIDFRQFAYGISAPSSALIDMLYAGIPTAVWQDERRAMDSDNYAGLTTVGSPREWAEFAAAATADPLPFLERQNRFLEDTGMILDPSDVYSRFARLFEAAARREQRPLGAVAQRHRVMVVANSRLPTVQLSFEEPLAGPAARGQLLLDLLTERDISAAREPGEEGRYVVDHLERVQPTALIFCRYAGPGWQPMVEWAKRRKVPVIYHIDDDLLAVPRAIGERKHGIHNAPHRIATVRSLLQEADLVYCSTERLKKRLAGYFPQLTMYAARIYCSGRVLRRPTPNSEVTVGYMASADHAHNLDMVLPAIERLLDAHDTVRFELFGSIPVPGSLQRFGHRVSSVPAIDDYHRFLEEFAAREWDIGICPLVPIDFNLMKADTKWVEYSSAGVAVVASRGTVYDDCCAEGCGILAEGADEWFDALDLLVRDADLRRDQIGRAQSRLEKDYGLGRLREQVFEVIANARGRAVQPYRSDHLEKGI